MNTFVIEKSANFIGPQKQLVRYFGREKHENLNFSKPTSKKFSNVKFAVIVVNIKKNEKKVPIETLEAKSIPMKVSWHPLPNYGIFVTHHHQKLFLSIFEKSWLW